MRKGIISSWFALPLGRNRGNDIRPATAADLVATWRLQSVADKPPTTIDIQDYVAEFLSDGSWTYRATMTGRFAGMSIQGSGTWKLDGEFLDYSAGALTGRTRVVIAGTVLTLSPDPVVVLDGKTNAITKYERATCAHVA